MLRKILVSTDFSESCSAALECARELAQGADAELLVLHVLELPVMSMGDFPYFSLNAYEDLKRGQRERLAALVAAVSTQDVRTRAIFHVGTAAATIVECAREEQAELIVVGTHARHGLPRMFLGSVAERVVRTSPVPVLTVRGSTPHTRGTETRVA